MCPPKCRNVTDNVTTHVDVSGRAHRPSPTVDAILRIIILYFRLH